MLLLLPVAWLLDRRQWWAALIPLATATPIVLLGLVPAAIYPVLFGPACWLRRSSPAIRNERPMSSQAAAEPGFFGARSTWPDRVDPGRRSWRPPDGRRLRRLLASNRNFNAGRGDFFYLADAFLHGRTWLTQALGPYDNVVIGGRVYVPFGPFPAILLMPIVAIFGSPERHLAADRQCRRSPRSTWACAGGWPPGWASARWRTGSGWCSCSGSAPRSGG
jgi:hypothetical protein